MSGPKKYRTDGKGTTLEGKRPGWFSMRHQSREAHDEAREAWVAAHPHSVAARRRSDR